MSKRTNKITRLRTNKHRIELEDVVLRSFNGEVFIIIVINGSAMSDRRQLNAFFRAKFHYKLLSNCLKVTSLIRLGFSCYTQYSSRNDCLQ